MGGGEGISTLEINLSNSFFSNRDRFNASLVGFIGTGDGISNFLKSSLSSSVFKSEDKFQYKSESTSSSTGSDVGLCEIILSNSVFNNNIKFNELLDVFISISGECIFLEISLSNSFFNRRDRFNDLPNSVVSFITSGKI